MAAALVDGVVLPGDVTVIGDRIATVGRHPAGGRGLAVPGFIDLQINGFAGADFTTAGRDGFEVALAALAARGVTSCVATIPTAAPAAYPPALATIKEVIGRPPAGAAVLGVHLEGPFLNPERRGAHPEGWLRQPDPTVLHDLLGLPPRPPAEVGVDGTPGMVLIITLAPELAGAEALISLARNQGVVVALGHSVASAEQAHAAFDAGATMVTHLWNAQSSPTARDPGLTGAALARSGVFVGLIADLAHVHADAVRFSLAALGDRAFVVSDAVALAGSGSAMRTRPDGRTEHVDGTAVRFEDGTLAGSASGLDQALRNLVGLGLSLNAALATVTRTPALALRRRDLGRLYAGGRADVVVLEDDLTIRSVLAAGASIDR